MLQGRAGQPAAGPDDHIVRQRAQQDDHLLSGKTFFAAFAEAQSLFVTLEGGFDAASALIVGGSSAPIQYKPDSLLVYVSTDDIDATLAKVESLGGKTVLPKTEIPQMGWWAVFADPTGNRIGLFTGMGRQS